MKREGFVPSNKSVVCSDHFDEAYFDRTGQTIRLKPDAVPFLSNLPVHLQKKCSHRKPPAQRSSASDGASGSSADIPNEAEHLDKSPKKPAPSVDHPYCVMSSPKSLKQKYDAALGTVASYKKKIKLDQQRNRRLRRKIEVIDQDRALLRQQSLLSSASPLPVSASQLPVSSPSPVSAPSPKCDDDESRTSSTSIMSSSSGEIQSNLHKLWSVTDFTNLEVPLWNTYAEEFYETFRVKRYIVNPNYILGVSEDFVPTSYHPTIDQLLERTENFSTSSFPSWNSVEDDLLRILPIFDLKDNDIVHKFEDDSAVILLTKLNEKLVDIWKDRSDTSAFDQFVSSLSHFSEKIIRAAKYKKLHEHHFDRYLFLLVAFFSRTTKVPIDYLASAFEYLDLDLTIKTHNEGKVMELKPNILMTFQDVIFLVGKVKRSSRQSEKFDSQMGHGLSGETEQLHQCPAEEDHADSSTDFTLKEEDDISMDDESLLCGEASHMEGESEPRTSKKAFSASQPYRELDVEEKKQVDEFLPELLAEMLACMAENRKNRDQFKFCGENENVQIGLALEGFKVQFVRLVLRNAENEEMPRVTDIGDPNVRCHVFITEEMNLFNPAHITMVFKILHSLTYMNSRTCQWQR